MGSSADENQANEFVSGANKTRANAARNKKQRDDAFKTYEQYPGDMLQTDKRVLDNIKIATDLENKARTSQINLPVPTIGSVAMNTISSFSAQNVEMEP